MGGKILTGIPELEQTFAGMAIECEVLLQGQGFTAEGPGNGVFKIALRNIKFNNFNEKLSGPEPLNWRTLVTPATSPVPEALKVFLESPVQGEMEAWKIKKVTLSADEPEWSVNFKKALVAAIKVQLPATMELPNQIPRSHPMTHRHLPAFWTVMEQGIDGVCENTSTIEWCKEQGSKVETLEDVLAGPETEVMDGIQAGIDRYNLRATSSAQRVQKWTLLPTDFSIPGGEMGPTLKVKRHLVMQKYKENVDKLYAA